MKTFLGAVLQIVKGDAVGPNQLVGEALRLTSVGKVPYVFGALFVLP